MKLTFLTIVAVAFHQAYARLINQCAQGGQFAMTFDEGPAEFTNQLLDILSSKNIKATFHVTTKYLTDPNVQSTIQRIAGAGHLIGLRTEASWNLMSMNDDQIRAGIVRQAMVLASFTGYVPKFIRLTYNGYDDRVLRAVESTGLIATTHNLETYDYSNDGTKTYNAVKLALSLAGKGVGSFISIQHDGVQQSVGVTGKVIDLVKANGYKLVKLDECLGLGDMTKNKEQLKGADDSLDLGPMAGAGGDPSIPAAIAAGEVDIPNSDGKGISAANSASTVTATLGAALMAMVLSIFIQL